MKILLSITLAAILVASVLASCAFTPRTALDPNITLTSSDAADAASWLDERLDKVPDRVVIGTDASAYGIDVSALEDDGFVVRHIGDEIAFLARTPDGLDRAVRRYAKAVEAGANVEDETYHEGYRVERFLLAGNDISTYAIRVDCREGFFTREVTNNTACTLSRLIGIACGFEPAVGGEAEHYIILRQIDDPSFRESSYRYHFENGDLVIEFIELFGSKNGAIMFLQNECGWTDLMYGFDVLEERELLDIPADLDVTLHPAMSGGLTQCTAGAFKSHGATLANVSWYFFDRSYRVPSAHHALGSTWGSDYGKNKTGHLICLTDEYAIEDTADEIAAYVQSRLDAGEVLGEGMAHIDLGMEDENNWCKCKTCYAKYLEEGATWAGPMIYFANRIESDIDSRGYDGIKYSVFAYAGSNMPPKKLAPNADVYVTLVMHDACDIHFYDGSQGGDGSVLSQFMIEMNRSYAHGRRILNNEDWGAWIRGWHDLGTTLYIRVATLTNAFEPFATMYIQYENMRFFAENGCAAIYNETYAADGLDFNYIVHELYQILQFNPGMSRADYYAEYYRLLEKYYGDGWRGVLTFADNLREAEENGLCRSSWSSDIGRYDYATFDALWSDTLAGLDEAIRSANSARQEYLCKMAKCAAIHMECLATYFFAYQNEDAAALDADRTMWSEMIALLDEAGYHVIEGGVSTGSWQGELAYSVVKLPPAVIGVWGSPFYYPLCASLDDQAWIIWGSDTCREVLKLFGVASEDVRLKPEAYR